MPEPAQIGPRDIGGVSYFRPAIMKLAQLDAMFPQLPLRLLAHAVDKEHDITRVTALPQRNDERRQLLESIVISLPENQILHNSKRARSSSSRGTEARMSSPTRAMFCTTPVKSPSPRR